MPITERDIVKIILGIVTALLLGLGSIININITQGWYLKGLALATGYVLFSIWKNRI